MAQNTISDELNRLIQAKAGIKSALEEKGLTIGDSSTLDEFPGLIQEMEVGGGGVDTSVLIDLIEGDITSLNIPEGTTKIGMYALSNKKFTNLTIPNTVTSIEHYAFADNKDLTNINLPNTITQIPSNMASGCNNLNTIIIPNTVTSIGDKAFSASGLTKIVIPAGVQGNFYNVFFGCSKLKDITFLSNTPVNLNNNTFLNTFGPIYVKNAYVDTYKNKGGYWNNVSTRITPLSSIDYDDTTYTVTASGRDNVELYVDASLINSSVYTFDSTTQTGNHTVTVKSVDPSLGVLDEVSQEITI